MYALAHAACRIQDSLACHLEITSIKIYSDCSSALSRIFDPSPHPAQIASLLFRKKIKEGCPKFPLTSEFGPLGTPATKG